MNYYVTVREISYYNVFVEGATNEAEAAEKAKELVDNRSCDDPYDREYEVTEGGIEEDDDDVEDDYLDCDGECVGCERACADRISVEEEDEEFQQREDVCPICGAHIKTAFNLSNMGESGDGELYLHWKCGECGISGKAVFDMNNGNTFMGHEVD